MVIGSETKLPGLSGADSSPDASRNQNCRFFPDCRVSAGTGPFPIFGTASVEWDNQPDLFEKWQVAELLL